jgi:hypothetical protein
MSIKWRATLRAALLSLRDFAVTILIVGGIQVLVGLFLWPIVFRKQPAGLSMALSAVGFGCWVFAFGASFADRRRRRLADLSMAGAAPPPLSDAPGGTLMNQMQEQVRRSGCGFVLLAASMIPLGIALVLRIQYDMRAGYTLREIFPPMP